MLAIVRLSLTSAAWLEVAVTTEKENIMRNIGVCNLVNRSILFAVGTLLALILASGNLSKVSAQGSGAWAITQAQQAVRQQISNQEGGRAQTIRFNSDAQTEAGANAAVRVSGTGTFSGNNDSLNNKGRWREFSYEATVANRGRYRGNNSNVSGVRYDWKGGWPGNGRDNDDRGGGGYRAQSIYCASDDGRRHICAINTSGGNVRLVKQQSGSVCVQGRSWGFDRTGIWVDRGCRADFEVSGNRGRGNDNADGAGGGGSRGATRPDGRVSYSGPIMNRHSDKSLDVTEQSMQEGTRIQQWSFADQANQNWNVIDLGNGEVAIISRHSGMALTVQGGRDNNGANIIQRNWNDNRQQRWRMETVGNDYYRITSVDNSKCLDVTEQGKQDGASIQLWDCGNQANQQWRLKR
jgi:hypothetical protein